MYKRVRGRSERHRSSRVAAPAVRHAGRADTTGPSPVLTRVSVGPAGHRPAAVAVAAHPLFDSAAHAAARLGGAVPQGLDERRVAAGLDFGAPGIPARITAVSYTHLRAHETPEHLVCRLLLEK